MLALGMLTAIAWPTDAAAYLLPSDAILSIVASKRAGIGFTTLVAEGVRTAGGERAKVWEGIRAGKAHRIELERPGATDVVLTIDGKRWKFQLGKKAGPPEKVKADLIMTFLGTPEKDPGGKRGILFLKRYEIDDEIVSLDRQNDRIAYVIGAKPWEDDKPQLWIDKEYMLPTRLMVKEDDGTALEMRLLDFGSGATGEWYPRRIETYRNGQLVESTTYSSANLNLALEDSLFEPPS
jgi:hypothetical protein